ncbi:cadmium resistance transporter [Limosilactobacillus sp. RRLNB_1_1]|uniref:Cadmium resistance transporter n=1 Tax=Limosilactobacillus albertensis TaxID=2759752 RepID=A0A7W3Y8U6_9LACO|nr:cadmium resistance transporter [Limosilactobacillus albertensis]MBB1070064.1 cadmium resistance transporter [Limosilactobacillus albertensis]MCD7117301.1 TMEM165/GDT1 family protein [Limosilactobacillus albertensis]MCD7128905.1 TMEM165/GDT1 family protein [Limosilactobacillus albertensis]
MNWWIIFITFLAVNLDFFFILIFLLDRYRLREVIVGYLCALLILVTISFLLGKTLAVFLPEWILGILGILPIYMALHDNDEDPDHLEKHGPIMTTLITYLAVCAGCNLSIFLPILTGLTVQQFIQAIGFVVILSIAIVMLIKGVGNIPLIKQLMQRYSEILMKIIYISVGCYVFWDSGLITHLIRLL